MRQQHGHTASSHVRGHFTPGVGNTLTQEHVETPREGGLGGYLSPTGANHSFQGCVIGFKAPEVGGGTGQGSTWYPALPKLV